MDDEAIGLGREGGVNELDCGALEGVEMDTVQQDFVFASVGLVLEMFAEQLYGF